MTQLSCSYITTASGSITITVDDLTLVGPGPAVFALYAGPTDRVLTHTGTGTLTLESLAVVHGNAYANTAPDDARGGCIYSSGSVHVSSGGLVDCYAVNARSDGGIAEGGAIFAQSTITLENSYLVSNVAFGYEAKGGAMRADSVVVTDSYVGGYPFGNTVYSTGFTGIFTRFPAGGGGGVYANAATISNSLFVGNSTQKFTQRGGALMLMYGQSSITGSLFFTNQAGGYGGAVFMPRRWPVAGYYQYCGSSKLTVTNSTFSRNVATLGAGLYAGCELDLANSTIAYNSAIGFVNGRAGGLMISSLATINSTIIAGNLGIGVHPDLDSIGFVGPDGLDGHGNLIARPNIGVPRDTIVETPPRLEPLALNGGLWPTLALPSDSPAVDAGNNVHNLEFDERGPGFPRVSGARADIGAYELQGTLARDGLFQGRFE